jgi:arabinose-5-phosphate isomerase
MTAVTDGDRLLAGIFTDGDLRRALDHGVDVHATTMRQVMTPNGRTVQPAMLAAEAVRVLEQYKINALLVVDERRTVVGALNIHDLLRAGVM